MKEEEMKGVERLEAYAEKIQAQLKLIPNGFPVCREDLEAIFSQEGKNSEL